jgi:hypothetical protein
MSSDRPPYCTTRRWSQRPTAAGLKPNVEDSRRLPRNPAAAFARCKVRGARTAQRSATMPRRRRRANRRRPRVVDQALLIFRVIAARPETAQSQVAPAPPALEPSIRGPHRADQLSPHSDCGAEKRDRPPRRNNTRPGAGVRSRARTRTLCRSRHGRRERSNNRCGAEKLLHISGPLLQYSDGAGRLRRQSGFNLISILLLRFTIHFPIRPQWVRGVSPRSGED